MPSLQSISQLFELAMTAQSKLVLQDEIFLATCLATLEKGNPLEVAEEMLGNAITSCNLQYIQNKFNAIVAESRTELYFVQLLQV